ncbi:IgGFc-binding protein-like isoform X2 [Chrysemys picta bellii]|uniref:IgGFc-binding protein-like isoform X2 n=1 Tax=Chrysemys picta bellii TaxID=8478 RepID=UPI0032B102B5
MEWGRKIQPPGAWVKDSSVWGNPGVPLPDADVPAKKLLLWLILALLLGPCSADPLGKEFVTVFMQNFVSSYGLPNLELHIASYSPNTTVDITVNHQRQPLPVSMEGGKVQVSQHGEASVLKTSFGLRVLFSQPHHITIGIPSSYHGLVQGMCGNSNGNASDDLVTPGGTQAPDAVTFRNTWRVPSGKERPCWSKCMGRCCSCLSANVTTLHGGQELCSMVGATEGPFGPCHLVVPPPQGVL